MAKLTRRTLIRRTSVGAASLGALMAVPGLTTAHAASRGGGTGLSATGHGPLAAYVRDLATGEVAVLVGTREIIVRDPELVLRLVKATQ